MPVKRASKSSKINKAVRKIRTKQDQLSYSNKQTSGDMAPAAVSMSRRKGTSYSSTVVDGRNALKIRTCVPICQIGCDAKNNGFIVQATSTSSSLTSGSSAAQGAAICNLSPYDMYIGTEGFLSQSSDVASPAPSIDVFATADWISPHVPLMSLAFDRYQMESLAFHYEPQATSTADDRLVFAWADDPKHPIISVDGFYARGGISQLDLLITKDSVAFMPWKPWSLSVPVSREPKFMYDFTEAAYEHRWSQFGSMGCKASSGSAKTYGVLYVELCINLFDPVPIVGDISSIIASTRRKTKSAPTLELKSRLVDSDSKKLVTQSDDDVDYNVAPPAFAGAPSDTPSGVKHVNLLSSKPSTLVPAPLASAASKARSGWL